jgi:hypothetical protein
MQEDRDRGSHRNPQLLRRRTGQCSVEALEAPPQANWQCGGRRQSDAAKKRCEVAGGYARAAVLQAYAAGRGLWRRNKVTMREATWS